MYRISALALREAALTCLAPRSFGAGWPSKGRMFAGCTVALVTPFRDGEVDYPGPARLGRLADRAGDACPESGRNDRRISDAVPRRARTSDRRVVEQRAGRAKVLPGTGSNATAEAIRLTKFAAKAGADGALVVAPYYNQANPRRDVRPLRQDCREWRSSASCSTTSPAGPAATSSRRRSSDSAASRTDRGGQGSERLAGSGQ